MLNDSINFSDVNLNDGVPLDSYTTSAHQKREKSQFLSYLDNFSFSVCFYNHAIFQYMYLREPVFGQFYHINSGILGRYT